MRKFILLLVLALAGVWAWKHPEEVRTHAGSASRWLGDALHEIADRWFPQDSEYTPRTLPPLPEGVFVLRESIPYTSLAGPATMAAGTELKQVGEGNGRLVLSDGMDQIVVEESKLTRDPKEVQQLKVMAANVNAMLTKESRGKLEAELTRCTAEIKRLSDELLILERRDAGAKLAGRGVALGTQADLIRNTITREEAQATVLRKKISTLTASLPQTPSKP